MSRRWRWALVVVILLAWGMRLPRLSAQSLWYDEAVTADVVRLGLERLTRWTADDIQPPFYYYLLAGWVGLTGSSEWALRFPSACFGLLAVPLTYALGRRLFARGDGAGARAAWLAALFAALSPLYIYYAQEARMYTLLTALGLLMALFLVDWLHTPLRPEQRRDRWLAMIAVSIAAVYTHYYAFFLILAFAVYFMAVWSRRRPRLVGAEALIAALSVAVAYVPWFPFVASRYRADASYWRGTLKIGEALRHTFIGFTLGETVLEPIAIRLLWGFGLVLALGIVVLLWQSAAPAVLPPRAFPSGLRGKDKGPRPARPTAPSPRARPSFRIPFNVLFLLCYLFLPVLGILAFSYRNPKFNPRYLMLASPALLLLWAGGLARLASKGRPWGNLVAALGALFIGASFLYSDYNLYADPAFTKPDFRGAVAYVQANRRPDEAVFLVSGHMSPAWDYYAPGSERTRLPDMDVLDTGRVLSYAVADDLTRAMEGKTGAWLVLWQDEVIDPLGLVDELLTHASAEAPQERRFWHVRVRHYPAIPLSAGPRFSAQPSIQQETSVRFGDALELVGLSQEEDGRLTLYWRALRLLLADLKVALRLVDEEGHTWGRTEDRRPAVYGYPTFRWRPGEIVPGRYEALPADPATPPGAYWLEVTVYDAATGHPLDVLDAAGAPQGAWATVGPVRLGQLTPAPDEGALPMQHRLNLPLNEEVELVGYSLAPTVGEAGDLVHLDLWWRARQEPSAPYNVWLVWFSPEGAPAADGLHPDALLQLGPKGRIVRLQVTKPIWQQATPGPWPLRLALTRGPESRTPNEWTHLALVQVRPTERVFTVPQVQRPSGASFGGQAILIGADLSAEVARPGATVSITLTWQAREPMTRTYTAFVHLLEPEGRMIAGQDAPPGGEARPTTAWVPGEVLSHRFDLTLPREAAPGDYLIEVGLYDARRPGMPRLPAFSAQGERLGDRVLLGTLRVE